MPERSTLPPWRVLQPPLSTKRYSPPWDIPKTKEQSRPVRRFLNNASISPSHFCSTQHRQYTSLRNLMYSQGELQRAPPARCPGDPGSSSVMIVQEYEWGALYIWIDVIASDHVCVNERPRSSSVKPCLKIRVDIKPSISITPKW